MKGHLRERSPGCWAIVLDLHDPATGKRRRKWHSFKGTKRQAQIECAHLIADLAKGAYTEASKLTITVLPEDWTERTALQVAPRTHERYAEIARKNIVPLLGAANLTKLWANHIAAAYSKALASGRRDGTG